MKKTYITPATDICACLPREFMFGAMDMSDPGFNKAGRFSNYTYFGNEEEKEERILFKSTPKLWEE